MEKNTTLFSFKKIETSEEAISTIKLASGWCFAYVCIMVIAGIFIGLSKIPVTDGVLILIIGFALTKNKNRALAVFLLLEGIVILSNCIYHKSNPVFAWFLVLSGIQAIRATSAYYRFNNASANIRNFFIKFGITLIYLIIGYIPLFIITYAVFPNISSTVLEHISGVFFVIVFYLGYIGGLPFTKRFKIVTFGLNTFTEQSIDKDNLNLEYQQEKLALKNCPTCYIFRSRGQDKCPTCGKVFNKTLEVENSDSDSDCQNNNDNKLVCTHCHTEMKNTAKYCNNCGLQLE